MKIVAFEGPLNFANSRKFLKELCKSTGINPLNMHIVDYSPSARSKGLVGAFNDQGVNDYLLAEELDPVTRREFRPRGELLAGSSQQAHVTQMMPVPISHVILDCAAWGDLDSDGINTLLLVSTVA